MVGKCDGWSKIYYMLPQVVGRNLNQMFEIDVP
jgi:hypothetical protein